jgi:hypothetical protein
MDAVANFSYTTVTVAPSPAASGTALTVADSEVLPAPPFNAVVWPAGAPIPLATQAEIVRVTANASGVLTIVRDAETGGITRSIRVGDQLMAAVTAGLLEQIAGAGGGESKRQVLALPASGEPLVGPNSVYSTTLASATARKLAPSPAVGDTVVVKVVGAANLTVEANAGQTIDGKASIEVGLAAGAENDSETFIYAGGNTWLRT